MHGGIGVPNYILWHGSYSGNAPGGWKMAAFGHAVAVVSPSAMEELDGDDVRVCCKGRYAERDIVQVTSGRKRPGNAGPGRVASRLLFCYVSKVLMLLFPLGFTRAWPSLAASALPV